MNAMRSMKNHRGEADLKLTSVWIWSLTAEAQGFDLRRRQGNLTRAFADLGLNVKALCRRHTLIFEPYADVGDDNYEDFTLNAG
jgi:hypothetical protein